MKERAHRAPPFEEVAESLSGELGRFLERMVADRSTAEDLLQETLLKIARGLPGFEGRSSVRTWAFTIATRVAQDHLRRPESRVQVEAMAEVPDPSGTEEEGEERLVLGEMNACIREVIDRLPEDYRAALVLHDLEGMTAAETAEICGCSLATAKIRIHRARDRLRQALAKSCTFYPDRQSNVRCDRKPSSLGRDKDSWR